MTPSAQPAGPRALELADVTFTYEGQPRPALAGISLAVAQGEWLALLGPSGAGKSTLCRTLNGIIPHLQRGRLSGGVRVLGRDTRQARVPELARHVGLVFQDFESQLFATSVELEAAFAPENFGLPPVEIHARVRDALAAVSLDGMERRAPAGLSGGQKQRLAIAAVLAGAPEVLVLDEATTDLDPVGKREVMEVLHTLGSRRGAAPSTVILATTDAEEALLAPRALVLDNGKVIADTSWERLLADPAELESRGVRPPDLPALFAALSLPERPATVGEAAHLLERYGLRPDQHRWQDTSSSEGASPSGEPVIVVRGLGHTYPDGTRALSRVDLELRRGEFVAILGANGSGKTTLAKHLNRLLEPTEGEVEVAGRPTRAWPRRDLARQVGYVFQNPDHQIFADTIAEEVAFGPRNFGLPAQEVSARVREALEAVGLSGRAEEDPFSLTKGERQRVAVASMLAARPEVMVFDEPTTGLDYRESRGMMELIAALHAQGRTVVIITHTMWLVAEYAQRAVLMREGRVITDAPVRALLGRPQALASASLVAPAISQLGAALGSPFRTVSEAVRVLRRAL